MKIDADEKEMLESVERGEWKSAGGGKRERTRYSRYAKTTFRKNRRLNIRLSSKELEAMKHNRSAVNDLPEAINGLKDRSHRRKVVMGENRGAFRCAFDR
jgi:predicted DNA binding CopG/RHH family protein